MRCSCTVSSVYTPVKGVSTQDCRYLRTFRALGTRPGRTTRASTDSGGHRALTPSEPLQGEGESVGTQGEDAAPGTTGDAAVSTDGDAGKSTVFDSEKGREAAR